MPHPLELKIDRLRGQIRRLLTIRGLAWTIGIALTAILLLSSLDYLINFKDHGVRLIASLTVAGIALWAAVRFLYLPLARSWRDVELARQVERHWPQLGDRLSSTVEFLHQSEEDAKAGSPALRRAVISTTTADASELDFGVILEKRPVRRALAVAGVVSAITIGLVLLDPLLAKVAVARLAKPLGSDTWPKKYDLAFRSPPSRLAAGQPFEVELIDRGGELPRDARIHYLYDNDGEPVEEIEPLRQLGGVMVARKDAVTRAFAYRAEGGDDDSMPWIELEVVEPPRVESLQVKVHPPQYTGWPAETAQPNFTAIAGSHIELRGESTKKLKSARLLRDEGEPIVLRVTDEGYGFSLLASSDVPLIAEKSGRYWFELTDHEGITGGGEDRHELRATADAPPAVTIEQPSDNVFVTADAVAPLRIAIKDDLAIQRVELRMSRSDNPDSEPTIVNLFSGTAAVVPLDPKAKRASVAGEARQIQHSWQLGTLGLTAGMHVDFRGVAFDYRPQSGESPAKRLTIITPKELDDRLAQRQTLILGELRRVLKLQEDARGQTRSFDIQLREAGSVAKQDVDHLQGAELNQRQIHRQLTSESEGIPAHIRSLLDEVASNRLDRPDLERKMADVSDALAALEREHLGVIERDLTSAIKEAQAGGNGQSQPESQPIAAPLASALEHQDATVSELEKLVGELSQWDSYRRFARDIGQIRSQQCDLERASKELGLKTLTKDVGNLTPQEQADLKKLAARQNELARGFDKLQQQMEEAHQSLAEADPLAAGTLEDALHHARRQAIGNEMRQSAGSVQKNQLGQAAAGQQNVGENLQELLDILANRREHELTRLVKKLREAQQELAGLQEKQQGLRKKVNEAQQLQDPEAQKRELERLAKQQQQLEKEAQRIARNLERLAAQKASQSASKAASKMQQLAQACEQCDPGSAEEQAQKVEKDLEQAEQQLAEQVEQAEQDLAHEQLVRMKDTLKGFAERQDQLLVETVRLEELRAAQGDFTRAQSATLRDLSRAQRGLHDETSVEAKKLAAVEAFLLALDDATGAMTQASDLLEQRVTDKETQSSQQLAAKRLRQLLGALESATSQQQPKEEQEGGAGGGGKKSGAQQDAVRMLAQLKLLKALQLDVNERFAELAESQETPTPETAAELKQLSQQQGRLADLLDKLSIPEPEEAPEDDPESLPVIRAGDEAQPADDLPGLDLNETRTP